LSSNENIVPNGGRIPADVAEAVRPGFNQVIILDLDLQEERSQCV
jgi:hypothetical protein